MRLLFLYGLFYARRHTGQRDMRWDKKEGKYFPYVYLLTELNKYAKIWHTLQMHTEKGRHQS